MESIEKINIIDRNRLNEEFYLKSLIEESYVHGLLSSDEIEKIKIECIELLAYKTECYNMGDSSSVRVEDAENIMISNLYTLGIYLKSYTDAEDAVKILKNTGILTLYSYGRKRIETKLKATRHIYEMVIRNKMDTYNYTYHATIEDGIKGFFKIYNPDYEAHDIRITADYPLCCPVMNLVGVEFVEKYLENVYYENMFCNYFSSEDIHHLLCGLDIGYAELVINIFEQVLTCAIGCKLAGIDARSLNMNAEHIELLKNLFYHKSRECIENMIYATVEKIQEELDISNKSLIIYIRRCLPRIISNICSMAAENRLDMVFIKQNYPELNTKLNFSFGIKMDDKLYREIVKEIIECRFLSDKILIIKNKIKSLDDLDDLFYDAELSVREITAVLNELDLTEIAALSKRHPYNPPVNELDLSSAEIKFSKCLHEYIMVQPLAKRNRILKTIDMLD